MLAPRAHLFFRKQRTTAAFLGACIAFAITLPAFPVTRQLPVNTGRQAALRDTIIPPDTLFAHDPALRFEGNLFYRNGRHFSGYIVSKYPDGNIQCILPVYDGMRHGSYKSFYPDGTVFELREYRHNLANGKHGGYWENGNRKFVYHYVNDKREGYLFQWYSGGQPYMITHYRNDSEEGLQQAWRENGKLFINYVASNGRKYGLEETQLCYTLKNQQIRKL